jgi:hypothetical protein
MIRALLFALLLASSAAADAGTRDGAWRGTLGKQAIVACFDGANGASGDYYYESRRWSIPLWQGDAQGIFQEGSDVNEPTGSWRILRASADSLVAEWRSPDRTRRFPIQLRRIGAAGGKDETCSETDAYNAPRVSGVTRGPAKTSIEQGLQVTRESSRNLDVERLQLHLPGPAGARIDVALDADYRRSLGRAYSCIARNDKGDFDVSLRLEVASARWIVVVSSVDEFCGVLHPEESNAYLIFDRNSGRRIDAARWLRSGKDGLPAPAIWSLLARKAAPEGECVDVWKNPTADLKVYPSAKGVRIEAEFAHVVQACDDGVELTLAEAAPFLTDEGKRALAPKP